MSETEIRYGDPVLCFVEHNFAWFTTRQLDKQWGDDWNDAPYEHNAGDPYEYADHRHCDPYELVIVAYLSHCYQTPDSRHYNSPYSVEMINKRAVAWLTPSYCKEAPAILAGTPLSEFLEIMSQHGAVFTEYKLAEQDTQGGVE